MSTTDLRALLKAADGIGTMAVATAAHLRALTGRSDGSKQLLESARIVHAPDHCSCCTSVFFAMAHNQRALEKAFRARAPPPNTHRGSAVGTLHSTRAPGTKEASKHRDADGRCAHFKWWLQQMCLPKKRK